MVTVAALVTDRIHVPVPSGAGIYKVRVRFAMGLPNGNTLQEGYGSCSPNMNGFYYLPYRSPNEYKEQRKEKEKKRISLPVHCASLQEEQGHQGFEPQTYR